VIKRLILILLIVFTLQASVYAYPVYTETVFTNIEAPLQDISLLSLDSAAMFVNGAVRYIDDDNLKLTPKLKDSRTYLPLRAVEILYNLYSEETEGKPHIYLKRDENELSIEGVNAYLNGVEKENRYLIYIEGEPYVAVRAVGEMLGNSVVYDNGYIIIGEQKYIDAYLSNQNSINYAKNMLDSFNPVETEGNVLYVSPTGTSRGNGSFENPYATIEKASAIAKAGDTIVLRGGIYRETIIPANNGEPGKPITYKAYENEKVTISALEEVSGFETVEGSIVAAPITDIGDGRNLLFYNGTSLVEARFPNVNSTDYTASDVSPWYPTKGSLPVSSTSTYQKNYTVKSSLLNDHTENKWAGATFVSFHGGAWVAGTAKIVSSSPGKYLGLVPGSFEVDPDTTTIKWWFENSTGSDAVNVGYITNTKEAIDLPGEWAVEDGKVYIYLPDLETADTLKVEMKKRQLVADLSDKRYINIDGINGIGGSVNMKNSTMCVLKNCDFKNISHFTSTWDAREGFFDTKIPRYGNPEDTNGAPLRGEMGIYISGSDSVVRDCSIDTSAGAAIYMTGRNTLIHNNYIINCGYMASGPTGIYIGSHAWEQSTTPRGGYIITNNFVRNSGRSSFSLQATEYDRAVSENQDAYIPCEIAYNSFSNGGIASCDTAVVYFWGATMGSQAKQKFTKFHNNAVYMDCQPMTGKMHSMIYNDNYVNSIEVYENIIFKTSESIGYGNDVYVQLQSYFPDSYAEAEVHDNKDYKTLKNGISDLSSEDYPGGRYFHTGIKK